MLRAACVTGVVSVAGLGCDDTRTAPHARVARSAQATSLAVPSSSGGTRQGGASGRASLGRASNFDVEGSVPAPVEFSPPRPASPTVAPSPLFEHLGYARPPAQTLACGQLGFVRLTEPGFEVYSYQRQTRVARHEHGAYTHVTAQAGYSYLLVGGGASLLYYQANPNRLSLGHLPA